MCPLFQQSQAAKFTPKEIKLSKLYQTNTQGKKLSGSSFESAKQALKAAGFEDSKIRKVLYKDEAVSVKEMQQIAEAMNKGRVFGFEKSPTTSIKGYLNKERVKAQSIARIRKEHILEASEEDLGSYGTTSLSRQGVSPNAPKAGEASILSRNKSNGRASFSLSGKTSSKPTSSLSGAGSATGSLSRPGAGGGGISSRPRF